LWTVSDDSLLGAGGRKGVVLRVKYQAIASLAGLGSVAGEDVAVMNLLQPGPAANAKQD